MSTSDGSNITGGGGAPGPGGGSGAGPGGGSNAATPTGEPLKIIKTQLIPHTHPASLQQQSLSPLPSPTTQTPISSTSSTSCTTIPNNNNNPQTAHIHAPIQLKNPTNVTSLFSLNPVAAKITHVKTTTIDAANNGALTLSGLTQTPGVGVANASGTIVTGGALSTVGAIKVGNSGAVATSLTGAPIALNTSQTNTSGATSIRAIGAGGQSTQVRVVMGNIMTPSMIKQLENAGPGRTQITAFPTAPARSVSNTSITVTRTATQATYLPRASVTATQMTGVGMGMPTGQRLVTPIRTTPASVTASAAGANVAGITATGNFVRGTAVSRNSSSPSTTVISPATSTTWMAANPTGQVQLIRAIPHQSRQRIITTQGIGGSPVSASGSVATISGTVVTSSASALQSSGISNQQQLNNSQQNQVQPTLQTVVSSAATQQQQQTYVATVLPPRHQATLVYSSNVATSQPLNQQQQQQFNQTSVPATGPRFAVATPLTGATTGTVGAPRQIRPIPFAKSFSAAKLNTTSISIRAPNLAPSISTGVSNANVGNTNSNSPRSTTVTGVTSTANVLPSTNLSAARIIQLQQQPGGTAQQIIGTTGRLAANVMLQPIIVNTSGTNKIGIRPPVTMAAKVQPSLTITQLGIGKLPSATGGGTSTLGQQQMGVVNTNSGGNNSPSISTASITATNLATNATTQLVNVSQGGQLLTTQNIVTSNAGGTAAGGATVVPLAISSRGSTVGNIITGTMTPIKNANAVTVGKVITQAQLSASSPLDSNNSNNAANNTGAGGPTNVFIHHAPAPQRPLSNSSTSSISSGISTSQPSMNISNTVATNVLTSTGNVAAGAFLQPGSTIYYESVPASSVQVSTGVLSLTTTTVTSSTMSQNQIASSAANLSISSLPFASHSAGQSTTATFTVVPSTGGRTIGQLQIPVSSAGPQIQAVPVRFSQLNTNNLSTAAADTIVQSQTGPQLLQTNNNSSIGGAVETSQIIIPASVTQQQSGNSVNTLNTQQTHQMVIPLQTSIKVTSGGSSANSTVVSNFLRKRDIEGSPIRAAKNLQPTLLSMGSNNIANNSSSAASSVVSSYSLTPITSGVLNSTTTLTTEALAKKERPSIAYSVSSSTSLNNNTASTTTTNIISNRPLRAESPASSDGSTTVSANSSPGVEQQIQDNMIINRLPAGGGGGAGSGVVGSSVDAHFNPINELYSNHHSVVSQQLVQTGTPVSSRNLANIEHTRAPPLTIQQRLNGANLDCPPRKKSRRSTNDSQLSTQSQTSLSLPPPQANNSIPSAVTNTPSSAAVCPEPSVMANGTTTAAGNTGGEHEVLNGKENAKPVEFILKRPKNCTLISTYKQSWKAAYNHFQRYSDIKPREERRPTIMDLANQTNVLGKINGWKLYHLKSQMEDLCENESIGYEKLSSMLKQMESNGVTNEIERISDLVKGNMQRSKIIVDGVSEAQSQIMKIFEHKSHVSDIITRCASKRNYKKREKV